MSGKVQRGPETLARIERGNRRGIGYIVLATVIFAAQDGITRHLASAYSPAMVTMMRFWFFAVFTLAMSYRQPGGVVGLVRTRTPWLQIARGVFLIANILLMSAGFTKLGVIQSHAIGAINPLIISILSVLVLGEVMGWRRWVAVGVGFLGELVILAPGGGVLSAWALLPAAAALCWAVYAVLTRLVSRQDSAATSFLYTGLVGCAVSTAVGVFWWQDMTGPDWAWMAVLCVFSASGHWAVVKAYSTAEAAAVQPFSYLQLVWVSILGVSLFGEVLRPNVAAGAVMVVAAGVFTIWRQQMRARAERAAQGQ